jgi:predicted HTH domain antitoxin
MLKSVKFNLPDELVSFYNLSDEILTKKILFLLVLDLLRQQKISRGKAAEVLGISVHEILEVMGQYNIPAVDYSEDELDEELEILDKMKRGA